MIRIILIVTYLFVNAQAENENLDNCIANGRTYVDNTVTVEPCQHCRCDKGVLTCSEIKTSQCQQSPLTSTNKPPQEPEFIIDPIPEETRVENPKPQIQEPELIIDPIPEETRVEHPKPQIQEPELIIDPIPEETRVEHPKPQIEEPELIIDPISEETIYANFHQEPEEPELVIDPKPEEAIVPDLKPQIQEPELPLNDIVEDFEIQGPASKNCKRTCNPNRINRVCGTDGKTYKNFCVFRKMKCLKPKLKFRKKGKC
ncbi:hypothetical protein SNEBB_011149 [Seison nebaliae]|nr:hypothetical protein SNEBB_011149 [Seison nebaliae]